MDAGMNTIKMEKLAEEIIQYIRKRLSDKMNYLTPVLHSLILFPVEENEALATDGKYLFYNPGYIIETYRNNPQRLQIEYMHIISHCILGHIFKRKGTHEKIYDAAADYMVNVFTGSMNVRGIKEKISLEEISDVKAIEKIVKSKGINGFYEYLRNNEKLLDEVMPAAKKIHKDNHNYWNHLHPELAKKMEKEGRLKNGIYDMPEWFRKYQQDVMKSWENLILMAEKNGYSLSENPIWGRNGGSLHNEFHMSPENNISYKDFLHRFMALQEKQKTDPDSFDYTWYTLGLCQYNNTPLIEPLETCEENVTDDLIIALDTSGSCINSMNRFLRETYNILSDMNLDNKVNIRIIQCDAKVCDDRVINKAEDLPDFTKGYDIKGFGGTNFKPVFDYIEKLIENGEIKRVRGLLYFSDGFGDFPKYPPDYETVFIFPPEFYINTETPAWITKVRLTSEDIEYDT